MSWSLNTVENFIKKNKLIALILVVVLMLYASGVQLGVISPGFEGAKCYFHGADFRFNPDWDGTYQLHKYQDAEDPLVYHEAYGSWDKIHWTSVATPNDAGIGWHTHLWPDTERVKPNLGVHVESNIQLEDVNRQGDPLGWNYSDPSSGRRIEYWSKTAVKEETTDKIYYHYTLEKESFIVVPAEFWVDFYLTPSQTDAGTGSGWREGEWQNIVVWFMLDWNTWDNAYKDPWLDDPKINVFGTLYDGYVTNKQRTTDYHGGFPIAGFIKGWEKAGWTSAPAYQENPQWYETRGKESNVYTITELAQLHDELMAKCSFAPSLVGQFISLYDSPSSQFSYELSETDFNTDTVTDNIKSLDSTMKKTMYFPINIQNFGTLTKGDWWNGYTIYYPSCYFRVRIIYGVYGKFTYLWTEELAKDPVVDYPDEVERHGTTVIHTAGVGSWFTGLTDWFTNPFNQLWMLFFMLVAVVIVVSVFSPGIWTALARRRRKET